MAQEIVDLGSVPNDSEGDPLRDGGAKINRNFTELYGSISTWALALADGLASKASNARVDALEATVGTKASAADLGMLASSVSTLTDVVATKATNVRVDSELALKASNTRVDGVELLANSKASSADLTALTGVVATKASNARVDTLKSEVLADLSGSFGTGGAIFYPTVSAGQAATPTGQFFYAIAPAGDPNEGFKRLYLRTGTTPFYVDQGDDAAPASRADMLTREVAFITVSTAQASIIEASVRAISTLANALYAVRVEWQRVNSEPAHPGKFRSQDRFLVNGTISADNGGWWEMTTATPFVEMFASFAEAVEYSGATRRPVMASGNGDYVISAPLVMPEGAHILCLGGTYNLVTRTTTPARQKGMARLSVSAGFTGDAIQYSSQSFNARLSGIWIDLTNQVSGAGVVWKAVVGDNPRTQARLDDCWVYKSYGTGVVVEEGAAEALMFRVFSSDSRTGHGAIFAGGDIIADGFVSAFNAGKGVHFLNTGGRLRSTGMEAFINNEENFVFEGRCDGMVIHRLVSDDAGRHGVIFKGISGSFVPNNLTIYYLSITGSSRLSPGSYDDIYCDYPASLVGPGAVSIFGANISGDNSRYRINGAWANSFTFDALMTPMIISDLNVDAYPDRPTFSPSALLHCAITGWIFENGTFRPYTNVATQNLMGNSEFDHWVGSVPADVMPAGSGVLSKVTTPSLVLTSTNALGVTGGAAVGDGVEYSLPGVQQYRGRVLTVLAAVTNPASEPVSLNTRVRVNVNGSPLSGAEQIILSKAGYQFVRIPFFVPTDANLLSISISPAVTNAASGRTIYVDHWRLVDGVPSGNPIVPSPMASKGWTDCAIVPFSGDQAAIDLRTTGTRIRATSATATKLVALANSRPMDEILVQFVDANVTLVTYSNIKRADGETADYKIPAGALIRFAFDGANWIADGAGINSLASISGRQRLYGIGADGVKRGLTVGGRLKIRNAVVGNRFDIPARNHITSNTWFRSVAPNIAMNGLAWSPELGLLCATAPDGGAQHIATSPDGVTWTQRNSAADNPWRAICWSPERGLFVAVSISGTGNRVMTSPDGITWTSRDTTGKDRTWADVCWSPELGLFVAVAFGGGATGAIMTSPDGISWTLRNAPVDASWNTVCWSPELGLFCAVAHSSTSLITSADGINWTLRISAASVQWTSVCWSPELGLFCATATSTSSTTANRVQTSPDGIAWTSRTIPVDISLNKVCWAADIGLFIAVAGTGTGNRVITSPDGVNWAAGVTPADNNWTAVCWVSELGIAVAVASTGSTYRAMTSVSSLIRPPQSASRVGVPPRATVPTDVDYALIHGIDAPIQRHSGTLTANRTVSLSTINVVDGAAFRITRTGNGAFTLSIGGLKNLVQNTWCDVRYTGGGWQLEAYGAL